MPDPLSTLVQAIIADDRAKARMLIRRDPKLAAHGGVAKAIYEPGLPHWIYAQDTALHMAAAGYRREIARMLLAAGSDVNAAGNHRRSRPLHYAADGYIIGPAWDAKRQVAILRLLIDSGAEIDAQDKNGATALHRAVRTRCAAAVQCLLGAGADVMIKNRPGSTPFHLAVQNTGRGGSGAEKARKAQKEIIETFLARGVSPKLKDARGKSVSDWARSDWVRELLTPA